MTFIVLIFFFMKMTMSFKKTLTILVTNQNLLTGYQTVGKGDRRLISSGYIIFLSFNLIHYYRFWENNVFQVNLLDCREQLNWSLLNAVKEKKLYK